MALPILRAVDALGIAHMQRLKNTLQAIAAGRNSNQMDVVGHEAIGKDFNIMPIAILSQPSQVRFTVFVREEDVFPPISTLGNVVRDTCEYGSGSSGH